MKTLIIQFVCMILLVTSCSVWNGNKGKKFLMDKNYTELYGEIEMMSMPITQDIVRLFCVDGTNTLPLIDTVEIMIPNKLNSNVINMDSDNKAFFAYYNGASIWIRNNQNDNELVKRIWNSVMRIETGLEGETFFVPETTITEGVEENGLCWRNVDFEFISYGYDDVPPEHKWFFDRILESFHKKTPSYQEVFEKMQK